MRFPSSCFVVLLAIAVAPATVVAREPAVDFQVISDLGFRSAKPIYLAINSRDEWIDLWTRENTYVYPKATTPESSPVPVLDFQKFTLLVASSGTKGNSGYSVAFSSVRESHGQIAVSVLDIGPGSNCPTSQEMTNPRVFALIPKTAKSINFFVRRAVKDCTTPLPHG